MKSKKIDYQIERLYSNETLNLSIDIDAIEEHGLQSYLYLRGLIQSGESFKILNRTIQSDDKSLERIVFEKKKFRVHLHSIDFFKLKRDCPKYVDVVVTTKLKSIMVAMNKVGYTEFPDGWNKIGVFYGENIQDFGKYMLDDSKNPFIKKLEEKKKQYQH